MGAVKNEIIDLAYCIAEYRAKIGEIDAEDAPDVAEQIIEELFTGVDGGAWDNVKWLMYETDENWRNVTPELLEECKSLIVRLIVWANLEDLDRPN